MVTRMAWMVGSEYKMTNCTPNNTSENALLYREREYIKVGANGTTGEMYLGLITVYPKQDITKMLVASGRGASAEYEIEKASLTLSLVQGNTSGNVYLQVASLGTTVDETASWKYSSTTTKSRWNIDTNYFDYISSKTEYGNWNNSTITFDVSDYLDLWKNSGKDTVSFLIGSSDPRGIFLFNSSERKTPYIGNKTIDTCKFVRQGEVNILNTEGVRVVVYHYNNNYAIDYRDETENSSKVWKTLNNSISKGNSFTFKSEDEEQGLRLGNVHCVLLDKECNKLIVSGLSLPPNTIYYTTAEFSGTTTIPEGVGMIEITNPDQITKNDLTNLKDGSLLKVEYLPSVVNNNAKTFTVDTVVDETMKNNKYRIYLKEMPFTENRTSKPTSLSVDAIRPQLSIEISTSPL